MSIDAIREFIVADMQAHRHLRHRGQHALGDLDDPFVAGAREAPLDRSGPCVGKEPCPRGRLRPAIRVVAPLGCDSRVAIDHHRRHGDQIEALVADALQLVGHQLADLFADPVGPVVGETRPVA